jgi:hypothetical protein
MKLPRLRTILLTPFVLFAILYLAAALVFLADEDSLAVMDGPPASYRSVAIFGASGTAGDGILKAALDDPAINTIHIVTRRVTPRIDQGVNSGKVRLIMHSDYLDYASMIPKLANVDAVFWALGTSSVGVDEETYGMIHVDFPMRFVEAWLGVSANTATSFHYLSSSDISADSSMMWAREKVRAETGLFALAAVSRLRVIAYRPDYIGPTAEQAHIGQHLLYWFFAPVQSAVRATQIGQAMIEVSARGSQFQNGDRLTTRSIIRHSDAYEARQTAVQPR